MIVDRELNEVNFVCVACTKQRELYRKIDFMRKNGTLDKFPFYVIRFDNQIIRLCHTHAMELSIRLNVEIVKACDDTN